mmetsp:Transcript_11578/g.26585  ORF Transcript_11578/g.26585 Transcript_11578/m.26585 type:complete len:410 (-) Transcript_11578:148-1377(-)
MAGDMGDSLERCLRSRTPVIAAARPDPWLSCTWGWAKQRRVLGACGPVHPDTGDLLRAGGANTLSEVSSFREYAPVHPSQPTVCVIGVFSADLLSSNSYGLLSAELACNWALAHGYRYFLFGERLAPPTVAFVWSKPRAMKLVLERGVMCSHALLLDADAAVIQPALSMQHLISAHLGGDADVLFACGDAQTSSNGGCHGCHCSNTAAKCSSEERLAELGSRTSCQVNSGVVLTRNGPTARRMFSWWASAGATSVSVDGADVERAVCPWGGPLPEQDCANLMSIVWPGRVQVISALQLNTPAWRSAQVDRIHRLGGFHGSRFERVCGSISDRTGWRPLSLRGQLACFNSSAFICHALGFLSVQRGQLGLKRETFIRVLGEKLLQLKPALRALLAKRGDRYRDFTNLSFA